ncbi:hypothetical protein KR222_003019, partial [Zaprionus bogoriensis]
RYNVSLEQLNSCDSLDIEPSSGYVYQNFFMVHSMENNKIQSNERLHLKFYVLTTMDAHILLSVTNRPRQYDRVYEIVIGAGGNTFSTIRTTIGARRVSTNQDPYLLSVYDPTPIEIVQTKDGDLYVYLPGFKKDPLLHFLDSSPLNVNYISFSSFGSNSARWFYDCEFDGYSNEMSQTERKKSTGEQLLDALIYQAQNYSLPPNLSEIQFSFEMRSMAYDQERSLLRTRMQLLMHWRDLRLIWEPKSYGQITTLMHPRLQIWTPQLVVFNGVLDSLENTLRNFELKVHCNGNVTLMANNLELSNRCVDLARNWPSERIECDINMGIDQNQALIALAHDRHSQPLPPNDHVNTPSGWTLREISVVQVENTTDKRYSVNGFLQTMAGDVSIIFKLHKNSEFFVHVFVVPLATCQIFIALSFLLRGYRRGALILITILLTSWGLMYISRYASPSYVPRLMRAYQTTMRISIFCYLLHITIVWLDRYPPRAVMPACVMAWVNSATLRLLLGLRFSEAMEYCDIPEQPWHQLAKMFNNSCFIAINIYFLVLDIVQLP